MNRFEQKRVERMWRTKDIGAIREYTAKKIGDAGDMPRKQENVIDIFRNKKK